MARKTRELTQAEPILVDAIGLQRLVGCGRFSAEKIAAAAGARVQIGRRVLYSRVKIEEYINNLMTDETISKED